MALTPESAHKLVEAINANVIVNYAAIGSTALTMVDYLEMLPREIRHMWDSQRLTVPKALFFALRYYVFIHAGVSGYYHTSKLHTGRGCNPAFDGDGYSTLIIHTLCEAISYARVYAFAGRQKPLLFFLTALFAGITVAEFYLFSIFLKTVEFAELPLAANIGCIPIKANNLLLSIIFWLILFSLCTITIIMMFMAYKRSSNSNGMKGLLRVFYRDGVFYFMTLSALAISNIIFDHLAPPNGLQFTMVQIQAHLNVVLTSRMLIHLRECARRDVQISSYRSYNYNIQRIGPTTHSTGLGELEWKEGNNAPPTIPMVFVSVKSDVVRS